MTGLAVSRGAAGDPRSISRVARVFVLCSVVLGLVCAARLAAATVVADFQFDAATGAPASVPISFPGSGTLTVRYLNPDASPGAWIDYILSDGVSTLGRLAGIVNGYAPTGSAYRGDYSVGATQREFKFSVSQGAASGTLALVDYLASGSGPTGTDRLIVDYSPEALSVPGGAPIVSITSGPFDANSVSANFVAPTAGFLMLHNTATGTHGGGLAMYVDGVGVGATLEIPVVPEFYLVDVAAGSHTLTVKHEDDLFGDNTGTRSADVYFVAAVPEPASILLAIAAAVGLLFWRKLG